MATDIEARNLPGETAQDANRYHERYTRDDVLMQLAEQLRDGLTADELATLARMLGERAEAIRQ